MDRSKYHGRIWQERSWWEVKRKVQEVHVARIWFDLWRKCICTLSRLPASHARWSLIKIEPANIRIVDLVCAEAKLLPLSPQKKKTLCHKWPKTLQVTHSIRLCFIRSPFKSTRSLSGPCTVSRQPITYHVVPPPRVPAATAINTARNDWMLTGSQLK